MNDIIKYLKSLGYEVIDKEHYKNIDVWLAWYGNFVKSFHEYKHYNGIEYLTCNRYTLGLPKKFGEAWADLLFNDNTYITSDEQELVDSLLKDTKFKKRISEDIELYMSLGNGAWVEYADKNGNPKVDHIVAPMIFPIEVEDKEIVSCAFGSLTAKGYYVNIHKRLNNDTYEILNRYFKVNKTNDSIEEIQVPGIKKRYISNVKMFQINHPAVVNNFNIFSPWSLSTFANAIDQIKLSDIAFDSFKNEFEGGRKRLFVKAGALNFKIDSTGESVPIFDKNQTEFFAVPDDDNDKTKMVEESNSELRITEHIDGIQTALNLAGDKAGFGPDYFTFKDGKVYTNSNQVISTQSKLYKNLKKNENILADTISEMIAALYYLKTGKVYTGTTTIDFDDSIIEDTAEIKKQAQTEKAMDLIDAIQYYQDVYKMTEEQAIEFYNKIQDRKPKVVEEPIGT